MKAIKIQNTGHARLFSNPGLELITNASPILTWITYTIIVSSLLFYSISFQGFSVFTAFCLFSSGLKFWTLFEYLVHRFVFHWISSNPRVERFTYLLHGNHHHYPKDKRRLFMPLLPDLLMSSAIFGIMYLTAGRYACAFFPGFILGHVIQSSIHYAIHAGPPPFKWLKPLWRSHQLHHYSNEEKGFGLSSTFWDHVFGTNFKLKKYRRDKTRVQSQVSAKAVGLRQHQSSAI